MCIQCAFFGCNSQRLGIRGTHGQVDTRYAWWCKAVNLQCRGRDVYAESAWIDTENKRKQKSGTPILVHIFTTLLGVRPKNSVPKLEKQSSFENASESVYAEFGLLIQRAGEEL